MEIIGRTQEIELMTSYLNSKRANLLAVIGRRRVGKTFLIREVYKNHKVFEMTGIKDAALSEQLLNFGLQMKFYFFDIEKVETPKSWLLAFNFLLVL